MKYYIVYSAVPYRKCVYTCAMVNTNVEGIFIDNRSSRHIARANKRAWDRAYDYENVLRTIK